MKKFVTPSSSIENANLYLFNPAGVAFGPDAKLDIKGSFHVSTADYLGFNGIVGKFHADLSKDSTLTVADPASFGFLSGNPKPITVTGSILEVPEGETLSVVGGDVKIENGYLHAPGGEVSFNGGVPVLDGFDSLGSVDVKHDSKTTRPLNKYGEKIANVDTSGEGGSSVYIRGGEFVIDGEVSSDTHGDKNCGNIDIQLTGDFFGKNQSKIESTTSGSGNSVGIKITTKSSENISDSSIESEANGAGDVGSLIISNGGISTSTFFSSNAGDIKITAKGAVIVSRGRIESDTGGIRDAGAIELDVGSLSIADDGRISTSAGSTSIINAGDITVESKKYQYRDLGAQFLVHLKVLMMQEILL